MTRIARRAFALLAIGSLLLSVAAAGMWVRSRTHIDTWAYDWHGVRWRMVSEDHRLGYDNEPQRALDTAKFRADTNAYHATRWDKLMRWQGVMDAHGDAEFGTPGHETARLATEEFVSGVSRLREPVLAPMPPTGSSVHYGQAIGVASAPMVVWLLATVVRHRLQQRRERRRGLCRRCGYDLRATPERCPECGLIKPREKTTA